MLCETSSCKIKLRLWFRTKPFAIATRRPSLDKGGDAKHTRVTKFMVVFPNNPAINAIDITKM